MTHHLICHTHLELSWSRILYSWPWCNIKGGRKHIQSYWALRASFSLLKHLNRKCINMTKWQKNKAKSDGLQFKDHVKWIFADSKQHQQNSSLKLSFAMSCARDYWWVFLLWTELNRKAVPFVYNCTPTLRSLPLYQHIFKIKQWTAKDNCCSGLGLMGGQESSALPWCKKLLSVSGTEK